MEWYNEVSSSECFETTITQIMNKVKDLFYLVSKLTTIFRNLKCDGRIIKKLIHMFEAQNLNQLKHSIY
jgi:hypothetical protein